MDPLFANAFNGRGFPASTCATTRARADFNEAIRLSPGWSPPGAIAAALPGRRRSRPALADHRAAVRLAPADADARADLCRLLTAASSADSETRRVCGQAGR